MLSIHINSFSYPTAPQERVLCNISFEIPQGAHLSILGESGCGKSTLLHLIYGSLELTDGEIHFEKERLWGPSRNLVPGHSFMKLVAQEYNIMPYISVAQNIASHLDRRDKKEDNSRVDTLLDVVGLKEQKNVKAQFLSGGQKQRVALAKALAKKPKVVLLDEPFSSIDTFQKNHLRRELFQYLKEENITCITATHESEEALSFADQMMLLKEGKIIIQGTPKEVYTNIKSAYQGQFFDDVTELSGVLLGRKESDYLYVLPHEICVTDEETPLTVSVLNSYYKGAYYRVVGTLNNKLVYFNHSNALEKGCLVYLKLKKWKI